MLPNKKEYLLYRITLGYIKYKTHGLTLIIKDPSPEVRLRSCEIYEEVYNKSVKNNLLLEKDIKQFLFKYNLWTGEDDKQIDILPKHIDYFKKQLYQNKDSTKQIETLKKYLNHARNVYSETINKLHRYDYVTCEGIANFSKWQYMIEKSVYYKGKRWNWNKGSINEALNYYYSNLIEEEDIREIARTQPFDTIFSLGNNVFGKSPIKLTLEQQRLLGWARLYANISKSPDCPPRFVVEDDDMFDGWLLIQKEKRELENSKEKGSGLIKNKKISNSDEVYIFSSLADKEAVSSLNDQYSKMIIKNRLNQVRKSGGELHEQDLADVQQKYLIQANQASIQAMRKKC
jgi:hypothetical protein